MENTTVTRTPVGDLKTFVNDMFTDNLKQTGQYNEQVLLDDHLQTIIKESELIIDVGAHIGYHSIGYGKINPNAKILSFEPQKQVFELLKQNIDSNNLSNQIHPFNLAVGDKFRETTLSNTITDGENVGAQLQYGGDLSFNLGGVSLGFNGEIVNMITIDSIVLNKLDFIKIDVEGAESLVLLGGKNSIMKFKPAICFEHNHKQLSQDFIKSLGYDNLPTPFDILKSFGYTTIIELPYQNFLATYDKRIGIFYDRMLVQTIGDTLGLTPIIEKLYQETKKQAVVSTLVPDVFLNNPYIKSVNDFPYPETSLTPCLFYNCNIIQNYANQLNLSIPVDARPKIYLSKDEIEYGKDVLKEFKDYKKIAVSLETGADAKNLRYDFITPLLFKLKNDGYKLIGIGKEKNYNADTGVYDKSFINKTTIREVMSIINDCDMYLGVDAGLYHIAAALDVPQVVFFRNNKSSNNRYNDTRYINSNTECGSDCLTKHLEICKSNNRCMDNFDLDEYYKIITKILPI